MRHFISIVSATLVLYAGTAGATISPSNPATFDGSSVNLVGSATMVGSALQLTNAEQQAGAAWLNTPLSTSSSFIATYSFSLANPFGLGGQMADGISFAMQGLGTSALGANGGNVGYTGLNAVGSVVQSWDNNTAGLNTNGIAYHTKAAPANLGLAGLVTGTESVSYNATSDTLTMTGNLNVDGTNYAINDTANVNLNSQFGPTMTVGFTGGTGGSFADQRITSFSVAAVPEPETYAMLLVGLGLIGSMVHRQKARLVGTPA